MTALKRPELTDDEIIMCITGLDLIARQLGNGQQQGGLAAIQEVGQKSAPVLALAAKFQALLPQPQKAEHSGPPPATPRLLSKDEKGRAVRKSNSNGAHA